MEQPRIFTNEQDVPPGALKKDVFESSLKELFFIENPSIQKTTPEAASRSAAYVAASPVSSVWVYYPERTIALRVPEEEAYFRLRTARNRNLISDEEQRTYRASRVGIAGLSVGSAAVAALVRTGGPKQIKIADFDTIEITNLNRIAATLLDVGENKADVAAREAWQLDPFLDIEVWNAGVKREELQRFIGEPRLDVMVDEMDDIAVKIALRTSAKELRVPVVMATDNGDSVILDIERFDEEPERPIFHGRIDVGAMDLARMDRAAFVTLSTEIIDPRLFTHRQAESVQAIGSTLSGVAQLGTAALIAGAAVAYAVRMIVTKQPLASGRYLVGCDFLKDVTNV